MKKFNIKAEEAIFFEDIPQNLVNPKKHFSPYMIIAFDSNDSEDFKSPGNGCSFLSGIHRRL